MEEEQFKRFLDTITEIAGEDGKAALIQALSETLSELTHL